MTGPSPRRPGLLPVALLTGALVASLGCGSPGKPPAKVTPLLIAVGAEVPLRVSTECGDHRFVCVKAVVDAVKSATAEPADVFEVRGIDSPVVTVFAKQAGVARLTVRFVDSKGFDRTVEAWLEARVLTRSTLDVPCTQYARARPVYPVTPGSTFPFTVRGYAGEDELDTGDLPLVEAPGFSFGTAPDGRTQATAPTTPGAYAWTLIGGATVDFQVYDAATASLSLRTEAATRQAPTRLIVEPMVEGVSSCVHGVTTRALVSVSDGGCFPVFGGLELQGEFPFDVGHGAARLDLEGDGACTLAARLDDGRSFSVTVDVPKTTPAAAVVPSGQPLSPTVFESPMTFGQGLVCSGSLSDGKCSDIYDGDCYVDSDWAIRHEDFAPGLDGGNSLSDRDMMGVGLTTRLLLRVEIVTPPPFPNIVVGPPKNLTWETSHLFVFAGQTLVTDQKCIGTRYQVLAISPQASGPHGFKFHADNLDDVGSYGYDASNVDKVLYRVSDGSRRFSSDTAVEFFVKSTAFTELRYQASTGKALRGVGPTRYASDTSDAGAVYTGSHALFTGELPNAITVSSPLAAQTQTLQVLDASGIRGVGGLADTTLQVGTADCLDALIPVGGSGKPIFGVPPSRPRVSLDGGSHFVASDSFQTRFCLLGVAAGQTAVRVDWGGASVTKSWTVLP